MARFRNGAVLAAAPDGAEAPPTRTGRHRRRARMIAVVRFRAQATADICGAGGCIIVEVPQVQVQEHYIIVEVPQEHGDVR